MRENTGCWGMLNMRGWPEKVSLRRYILNKGLNKVKELLGGGASWAEGPSGVGVLTWNCA